MGSVFLYHYFLGVADEKFAAGFRNGTAVSDVGKVGYYWSATYENGQEANCLNFKESFLFPSTENFRAIGCSVRLVKDVHKFSFL